MKFNLHLLEMRLQSFIEDRLAAFPWNRKQDRLAERLVEAMQSSLVQHEDGQLIAPNNYLLTVHTDALAAWQARPDLLEAVAQVLYNAAGEMEVAFQSPPVIRLAADPSLLPDTLRVSAVSLAESETSGSTAAYPAQPAREENSAELLPPDAFLIVNGSDTLALRQPVINIGRKLDNHIVVDDPRVSRAHAQLRAIRGHFVLFDLNSSGGTFINGQRIRQQTLRPGDVISLSGVPIIYSEEIPPQISDTTTFHPGQPT